jgi:hypothetical protein
MRLQIALVLAALAASLSAAPSSAEVKFIKVTAAKPGTFLGAGVHRGKVRFARSLLKRRPQAFVRPTGFAIPRRRLVEQSPFEQRIRFATPEWAYSRFKRRADLGQSSHLWQSHLRPSPGYPVY